MPRTALTIQDATTPAGITPTYAAVDQPNGNSFANLEGEKLLHVKNGSGSPVTVTILTPATLEGEDVTERAIVVAAGAEMMRSFFPHRSFNQADGNVYVDWSVGTSITCGVFKVAP